jgi:hypothetical protein
MTVKPENCRNLSDDHHLGMSHYMTKYYRDKSWIFYKICCRAALKDTEAVSAVVAPTLQICAFRHVIIGSWKIKMYEVNVFFYNRAHTKFY